MAYEIVDDLPVPDRAHGRDSMYPFASMEVGQAFKFSAEDEKELKRVTAAASAYRKKDKGKSFAIRKIDGTT